MLRHWYNGDGRLRVGHRMLAGMGMFIVVGQLVGIVVSLLFLPGPENPVDSAAAVVFGGIALIMLHATGVAALKGRFPRWLETMYYATWGRLLGDYRLKR